LENISRNSFGETKDWQYVLSAFDGMNKTFQTVKRAEWGNRRIVNTSNVCLFLVVSLTYAFYPQLSV
jgi:hypothetical protein